MSSEHRHEHPDEHVHDHHEHPRPSAWAVWRRWQGLALASAVLVSTAWLAASGQLVLYIHPRYVVFTVVMAAIGFVFVLASFVVKRESETELPPTPLARWSSIAGSVFAAALAFALVVIPPATLTTATASQREINSTALGGADDEATEQAAVAGAFGTFTVLDWASLLRQTSDRSFYADKPADVIGFVTPDPDDPEDSFYVSRFKITCCAVDAQPVGVPVHYPSWQNAFEADEWVEVTGIFDTNPSRSSAQPLALIPNEVEVIEQPEEPYLF